MTASLSRSVAIGIPVHNRIDDLRRLLASLRLLDAGGVELSISVVDDGSEPPLRPLLENEFRDLGITFYRNEEPAGPGAARNRVAAAAAKSEFLWFLDSDVEIISPKTLERMIALLDSDPALASAGGTLEEYSDSKQIVRHEIPVNFLVFYRASEQEAFPENGMDADAYSGGNFFVRRELFVRAGGFREELFRDEDNDLCLALRSMGYKLRVDSGCLVEHHRKSAADRDIGVFTYFSSMRSYITAFLEVRISLLERHSPGRLLFLPLLDLVFTPGVLLRLKSGRIHANRLEKAEKPRAGDWLRLAFINYPACYFRGIFRYFFGSLKPRDADSLVKGG